MRWKTAALLTLLLLSSFPLYPAAPVYAASVAPAAVSANPATVASTTSYTVQFVTSSSGSLLAGNAIIITAPPGTTLSGTATDYTIAVNHLHAALVATVAVAAVNGSATANQATLTLGTSTIAGGDTVTVTAAHAVNPTKASNSYTMTVSTSTDTTPSTSQAYAVTPGPASGANSALAASPASIVADGGSTSTITVQLRDQYNNDLISGGDAVVLSTTAGTLSAVTDNGNGTYTASLTSSTTLGTATVSGTVNAQALGNSASVDFTVGPVSAAASATVASPTSVTADGTSSATITVTLMDDYGHAVRGKQVTLSASGGSSVVTVVNATSDANGQASFTLSDTKAETVSYTAADTTDGISLGSTSVSFTAGPVDAGVSTVTASPGAVVADGTTSSSIVVTLLDANGNPVGGKAVTLAAAGGSSVITTVNGTTDANGQAAFTVTDTAVEAVRYDAGDSTDNLSLGSVTVNFTAGPVSAAASATVASPTSVTADGTSSATITVTLMDDYGHAVRGKQVTLSASGGSSVVTVVNATSDANGQASFTVSDTKAETVSYTAADTTDGTTLASVGVSFTPGPASPATSQLTASPTTVPADGASTIRITIGLEDANGNRLATGGDAVTLSSTAGTLSSVTDNGDGTYSATLTAPATVGSARIQASVNGQTLTQDAVVNFGVGAVSPDGSTVRASPLEAAANRGGSITVSVVLRDAHGHAVGGKEVVLAADSQRAAISPLVATTDVTGQALFTVRDRRAETVTLTARDQSDGLTLSTAVKVTFTWVPVVPAVRALPTAAGWLLIDTVARTATLTVDAARLRPGPAAAAVIPPQDVPTGYLQRFALTPDLRRRVLKSGTTLSLRAAGVRLALTPTAMAKLDAEAGTGVVAIRIQRVDPEVLPWRMMGTAAEAHFERAADPVRVGLRVLKAGRVSRDIYRMDAPFTLTLDYDATTAVEQQYLGLYRFSPAHDAWVYVGGWADRQASRISAAGSSFSTYAVLAYHRTFADLTHHWARRAVEILAAHQIVRGVTATAFAPDRTISRAEFTVLLARLLNLPAPRVPAPFTDVRAGSWYADAVNAAYAAGLVRGSELAGQWRFDPAGAMTREEMAAMLVRALPLLHKTAGGVPEGAESGAPAAFGTPATFGTPPAAKSGAPSVARLLDGFHDGGQVSVWARPAMAVALEAGIVKGSRPGWLEPQGLATRAEAAAMLARVWR